MKVCVCSGTPIAVLLSDLTITHSSFTESKSCEGKSVGNSSISLYLFHMIGEGLVIFLKVKRIAEMR